jgi:hypothetical protein
MVLTWGGPQVYTLTVDVSYAKLLMTMKLTLFESPFKYIQ